MSPNLPQGTRFTKYQALGNDYLVIQPEDLSEPISAEWVRKLTDRHFGVGADGILLGPFPSESADFALRIFNPDGSEAEKSGNGVRIFARHLWETGFLEPFKTQPVGLDTTDFRIQTLGGIVTARMENEGRDVRVAMGRADFRSASIPMSGPAREAINETIQVGSEELTYCAVNLGNPHCVVLYSHPSADNARRLGPQIERAARFLKRTNVQFMQVIDRKHILIEIWERGAGYTLSSGSSSCAAAAVAYRLQQSDDQVAVHNPGGVLQVTILDDFNLVLTGPVEKVFSGWG